jgi:hypothetical protein
MHTLTARAASYPHAQTGGSWWLRPCRDCAQHWYVDMLWLCTKDPRRNSPATVHGALRVMSFILLCIGTQLAFGGFFALAATYLGC